MTLLKAISALTVAIGLSAATTPRELLVDLANALSTDNPEAFLKALAPKLADELRPSIEALCARYDITTAIEVLSEEETTVEADWYLELKERSVPPTVVRRRERVKLSFEKFKKGWRVTELQPRALLAPPQP